MSTVAASWVGQRLRRKEDARLVRGAGRFTTDIAIPGALHAAVLRSPFAHAQITSLDIAPALEVEGVVAAVTGADLAGRVGTFAEAAGREITPALQEQVDVQLKSCPLPAIAHGRALWVGQPVAVVVARDRYTAEDGLEAIEADYEPLDAIPDAESALGESAPLLHEALGDNVAARLAISSGDVDAAFAAAPHTLRERFTFGRSAGNAMETRSVQAAWDEGAAS